MSRAEGDGATPCPTDGPRVSVIVPTRNQAHYLPEALDSALAQSYGSVEVVALDDGSTDDTAAVLESYGDRIRALSRPHSGLSATRNHGIEVARGSLIAFLDSDDRWEPEKLAAQVQFLDAHPEVVAVATGVDRFSDDGPVEGTGLTGAEPPPVFGLDELRGGNPICVSSVMARRCPLIEAGLFDSDLASIEDYDLWLRLARDHRLGYLSRVLTHYRVHPSAMSRNTTVMASELLRVLGRHFDLDALALRPPDDPSRRLLAQAYHELAYGHLVAGRGDEARAALRHAVRLDPWRVKNRVYWLFSGLDERWIGRIRRLRRGR